jgi:hypothetical protein
MESERVKHTKKKKKKKAKQKTKKQLENNSIVKYIKQ